MHRAHAILVLAILSVAILCGGCAHLSDWTVTKRNAIDDKIVAARVETEARLADLNTQQMAALNAVIAAHANREQAAADHLFKGAVVGSMLKSPTRPEQVMTQSIQLTATQLPPATPAAQVAAFKTLQTELDEAKVSATQLKIQYEAELAAARADGEAKQQTIKELGDKVQAVDAERVAVLAKAAVIEQGLQKAKDVIQDKATKQAQEEATRAKSTQAIKTKMSAIVGGLALLCLAGAIWSPVSKDKFGIAAAILGLAAVAIWYVQPWHIALAVGLLVLILIGWAAKHHYVESRAATNVYRAIQEVKTTARDDYDRVLKGRLTDWNTAYTADGTLIPDTAAIKHIDARLRETDNL